MLRRMFGLMLALALFGGCAVSPPLDSTPATATPGNPPRPTVTTQAQAPTAPPASAEPATPPPATAEPTRDAPPAPAAATAEPAAADALPAPVYLLSDQSGSSQIWRIEPDGATVSQITEEDSPVTHFDIAPASGHLAYVSANDLLVAAADGSERALIFDGPEPNPAASDAADLKRVTNPRWSPTGASIAFGLDGVQLIPASGGEPVMAQANEPPTFPGASFSVLYEPLAWSPDGGRLLLSYAFYPEGGGLAALDLNDRSVVRADASNGLPCCDPAWSLDGSSYFYAFDMAAITQAGLWRADAATGAVTTILGADERIPSWTLVRYPQPLPEGSLRAFVALTNDFAVASGSTPRTLQLAAVNPATGAVTPLRSDSQALREALWAADGSGAVVSTGPFSQDDGPLAWLPAAPEPALPLPAAGRAMRWGVR